MELAVAVATEGFALTGVEGVPIMLLRAGVVVELMGALACAAGLVKVAVWVAVVGLPRAGVVVVSHMLPVVRVLGVV
ncbi:hypothetical protein MKL09_04310, partial [Methylobacterium sp. J-048]|uniref:hypothetical protein n=1 Tax=Methylobacterium sp. J-048 TaxID=2836635 RepID=UPI001FB8933C